MTQARCDDTHDLERKKRSLLDQEIEAPLVDLDHPGLAFGPGGRTARTVIDQPHFPQDRSRPETVNHLILEDNFNVTPLFSQRVPRSRRGFLLVIQRHGNYKGR